MRRAMCLQPLVPATSRPAAPREWAHALGHVFAAGELQERARRVIEAVERGAEQEFVGWRL